MNLSLHRFLAIGALCIILIFNCGKDSTSPDDTNPDNDQPELEAKTFAGKIISIDEDDLSWEGLRFGLITFSALEIMGETQYYCGEAYCVMDIGADSTFSFELPAQIESRWVLFGNSCTFYPIAYNDTNGNGIFDHEPESELYDILYENGEIAHLFIYFGSSGWNYSISLTGYSTDFDHEFLMGTHL